MQRIAFYAGSFDPPTNGHLDIIAGGLNLADKLVLAIGIHHAKQPLFSFEERVSLLHGSIEACFPDHIAKIDIIAFDGLLIDKAREIGAKILIRGLRDATDFDYEMRLAGMNKMLAPGIDTIFIPAQARTRHLSATLVRQIATMRGDLSSFVPGVVRTALIDKFDNKKAIS